MVAESGGYRKVTICRSSLRITSIMVLALLLLPLVQIGLPVAGAAGDFSFVAAGDWGSGSAFTTNLNSIGTSGANFALAVGDFSYSSPANEQTWCTDFKNKISNVELIVGNHETWESNTTQGGGSINKYTQYCPFTLGTKVGSYGFQYYFDYPSSNPIARFIMVEPAIWNGTGVSSEVSYTNGTATQAWVGTQIDSARAAGIPWVVVGMHKVCISTGGEGCEIGQSFMRFLISKRVDVVLQGHDHNYQRSKQLTCATAGSYVSSCVSNNGSSGSYSKGAGTIFLIDGTGGAGNSAISNTDSENGYFAAYSSSSIGYTKYTVSTTSIQAQFVPVSGSFIDSWSIVNNAADFTVSANPTTLSIQSGSLGTSTISLTSLNGFAGTVSLSTAVSPSGLTGTLSPSSVTLSSGGTGTSTLTVSSSTTGTYAVTATGTSGSLSRSTTVTVTVTGSQADFSISSNPSNLTIQSGSSGTSSINLSSLNSFSSTVTLSAAASPSGLTPSLIPTSISLSSGGSASSTLTVSSPTVGTYFVTVTGTSGSLSHSTTVSVTVNAVSSLVASDGTGGPASMGTGGGEKIIQDSAGKIIAVYVDSTGRIGLAYANSDPILAGWSIPVKSSTPASAYVRPAAVLISLTSLRIITEGGSAAGQITDIPVTVQRDSQNNIAGFAFGTATILDSTGTARYATAVPAHNGDILSAWAWKTTTTSQLRSLRWHSPTGWTNFAGTSATPDNVIVDNTSLEWMIPSIIERLDNNNIYLLANRLSGPPSTLAYNLASWNGSTWSWGTQNLTYETNSSSGVEDPVTLAWDPTASLVVASYGITGGNSFGMFTLNSLDQKTHINTPSLPITERDWGSIAVHITTGDYYIFLMNVNTDGGSGTLGYIRHPAGGSWSLTLTLLDSATDNQGLNVRATGSGATLDLLYAEGTSAPAKIKFTRLTPFNPPNFSVSATPTTVTVQAGSSGTSTLTLKSLYNFTGIVSLSTTVSPSGLTASLIPASVTLTSGGTATSTLTVSSTASGTFTVTVQATSGALSHSTTVSVKVTDFTVSAPSSVSIGVGASSTATITLSSLNGFTGTVAVASTVSPSGLTASVNPASVTLSPSGTSTSTLTLSSSTVGSYTVTVTGTSGSLSHSVTVSVSVTAPPDFNVSVGPSTVTFPVGSSGTSIVTLTSLNSFAGSLTLSKSVTPSTGLIASCTPTSVTLASGGSATSNCNFSSSTTGSYTVIVSATNGTLTHSTTITVNVTDFTISANPTSQTILVSPSSSTSTITLASLNGFSATVSLALTAPAGITASLTQTTLSLNAGATATSILTFSSTTIGNYTLTVTATSGSLTHSVRVTVKVVDFSISSSSTSLTIFAGQSSTSTVTLNSQGGFAGSIALTTAVSPSGLTASMNPASVSLTSGGSDTSTLTVSSSTGGSYTVAVTGTSGSVFHSVQIIVNVLDYTVSANPSTVGLQSGSNGTSTIILTSLGGFSGNVSIAASANPSGLAASCSPDIVSLPSGGSTNSTCTFNSTTLGTYTVTITTTSGPLSHSAILTVGVGDFIISSAPGTATIQAGSSGTSSITLTSQFDFTGTVNLSTSVSSAELTASLNPASLSLSPGGTASSTLSFTSNTVGTFTVTVSGTVGSLTHSIQVTVNVVDFTISASSTSLTILAGSSGTSPIQLGSLNGFVGTVTLSTSILPSGPSASVNPTTVSLSSGSASSILTVSTSAAGNYTVTVTATSGSLTHTVQVSVQVLDFTVTASPSSLSVPPGTSSNTNITLTSVNGLSGTLSLTATISPSGPTPSLNPTTVALSAGGTGYSLLTVSTPSNTSPGIYTVTITATIGTLSHTVAVTVNVPDFSINASPTTVNFVAGSSGASTLNLASLDGFTGNVTLTATASSPSLTATLSPASLVLSSGGSGTSTLTLSSSTGGTYTVTVTGTSGSSTHSVTIIVNVQDFSLSATPSSLSIPHGGSGTLTINLASIGGFAGAVSISATCSPSGPKLTLSSSSVSLTSGGSGTDTLTVRVPHKTAPGTYTITITGTSGSLTHTITVVLTVT